jgi:hypothetical protein
MQTLLFARRRLAAFRLCGAPAVRCRPFSRTTLRAQSVPSKISTFLNKKMTPIVAYAQDLESFRALNNVMLMLVRSVPTYIHTALLHARLPSHTISYLAIFTCTRARMSQ